MHDPADPRPYAFAAAGLLAAAAGVALSAGGGIAALLALAAAMVALQALLLRRSARTGLPREVEHLRASLLLGEGERLLELGGAPPSVPDASVDAVLGVRALDRLPGEGEREALRRAIARVLRPGGRVALLDARATHETVLALEDLGLADVRRSGLRWAVWPPARAITAHRPAAAGDVAQ